MVVTAVVVVGVVAVVVVRVGAVVCFAAWFHSVYALNYHIMWFFFSRSNQGIVPISRQDEGSR